jgi:hypothetical protein
MLELKSNTFYNMMIMIDSQYKKIIPLNFLIYILLFYGSTHYIICSIFKACVTLFSISAPQMIKGQQACLLLLLGCCGIIVTIAFGTIQRNREEFWGTRLSTCGRNGTQFNIYKLDSRYLCSSNTFYVGKNPRTDGLNAT